MEWFVLVAFAALSAILIRPAWFADTVETPSTPAEPPEPTSENLPPERELEAEPVTELERPSLVDYEDEFGGKHRVSPETAAWLRYQENRIREATAQPAPAPQAGPEPEGEAEPLDDAQFSRRFRSLEQNVQSLHQMLNDARERSVESVRINAAGALLDEMGKSVPYFQGSPLIAGRVRDAVLSKVRQLRGAPQHDDRTFMEAVKQEALNEVRQLRAFATEVIRESAAGRKAAADKAPAPAGGLSAGTAARKGSDEMDWEKPNEVSRAMFKELSRLSRG